MLIQLWSHIPRRRRKQLGLLLMLMFLASFAEVISLGSVLPFLGVLSAPEEVYRHPLMQPINQFLELTDSSQLVLPLTIVFIVAALLAGTVRLILLYVMTRLSFAIGADLSINIYRRTLYQEYSIHVARNSSEVINGIITKVNTVINGIISPVLTLISSTIMLIGIIGVLFVIDVELALISAIGFGVLYWGVISFTRQQLRENSQTIADQSTQMIKALQEGLGGIRDVLIDGSQRFYCNLYRNADLPMRRASGNNQFISGSPRYVMEAIGMVIIAWVAYFMTHEGGGMVSAIPVLGTLALGAQRLLPVLQQAYRSYSTIKGVKSSFQDVLNLLNQPIPEYALKTENKELLAPITFEKDIRLKNLGFCYTVDSTDSQKWVLKNINLTLTKGSRVGFIGVTGSGKSTMLDVVMGLLAPTEGQLTIDELPITSENRRAWQVHIAHVPQNIYLSDSSIEENIAFGIPKEQISHKQVKKAAQQAQIAELIEEWQDGYQTFVGERGVKLSGGQRQRIGVARALYKQADVLIFDEATSALDNETEQAVMDAIKGLGRDITIMIIAHRLTTLQGCDQIVKLDKNNIVQVGSYEDIVFS